MQLPLGKRVDLDTDPSQRQYDLQSVFLNTFLENQKTDFSEKFKNEVFEILDQNIFTKLTEAPPRGWGVSGQKLFP